jgi:TRAP-type C4-dicarboxylate transport system permease small subunit
MALLYNLPFFLLVGWFFYRLAAKYEKDKWWYAIQGILMLFLSTFLIGYLFDTFIIEFDQTEGNKYLWILWFALTLSVCAIYYRYLENAWRKNTNEKENIVEKEE